VGVSQRIESRDAIRAENGPRQSPRGGRNGENESASNARTRGVFAGDQWGSGALAGEEKTGGRNGPTGEAFNSQKKPGGKEANGLRTEGSHL